MRGNKNKSDINIAQLIKSHENPQVDPFGEGQEQQILRQSRIKSIEVKCPGPREGCSLFV